MAFVASLMTILPLMTGTMLALLPPNLDFWLFHGYRVRSFRRSTLPRGYIRTLIRQSLCTNNQHFDRSGF